MRTSGPVWLLAVCISVHGAERDSAGPDIFRAYRAKDTLAVHQDPSAEAREALARLAWDPVEFEVECERSERAGCDAVVRFHSPVETGNPTNDRVVLQWYAARDEQGQLVSAPAMVVVHESGSEMPVGRLFARGIQAGKIHAFLIHLPHYGLRRSAEKPRGPELIPLLRQAVADVRRARDAVDALPMIDRTNIGVQGTSLGGFVTATAASLDGCFTTTFIVEAGADLYRIVAEGKREAAEVRQKLKEAGLSEDDIKEYLDVIEPKRLAHRLKSDSTWLISARQDQVVPFTSAVALAQAARLPEDHHIVVNADHYTSIRFFPFMLQQINEHVRIRSPHTGPASRPD